MTKKQRNQICAQVLAWQEFNRAPNIIRSTLSKAESQLFDKVLGKGALVYRHGWPDFLLDLSGKPVFIEVKAGSDMISERQGRMFAAIERLLGIYVWVWNPERPSQLTPWRKYEPSMKDWTKV